MHLGTTILLLGVYYSISFYEWNMWNQTHRQKYRRAPEHGLPHKGMWLPCLFYKASNIPISSSSGLSSHVFPLKPLGCLGVFAFSSPLPFSLPCLLFSHFLFLDWFLIHLSVFARAIHKEIHRGQSEWLHPYIPLLSVSHIVLGGLGPIYLSR